MALHNRKRCFMITVLNFLLSASISRQANMFHSIQLSLQHGGVDYKSEVATEYKNCTSADTEYLEVNFEAENFIGNSPKFEKNVFT